jgi:hypothetical protein
MVVRGQLVTATSRARRQEDCPLPGGLESVEFGRITWSRGPIAAGTLRATVRGFIPAHHTPITIRASTGADREMGRLLAMGRVRPPGAAGRDRGTWHEITLIDWHDHLREGLTRDLDTFPYGVCFCVSAG